MNTLPCGRKRSSNANQDTSKNIEWKAILGLYLKEKNLRSTSQRENVAEMIFAKKSHFEVQTLIKEVQSKYPAIGPATVYRSVKTLCDAGLLHESLQSHSGVTLYEAHEEEHHDHLVCLDCGEIFEFHDESLEDAQNKAIKKMGFNQAKHKHVIYAKCALLQKK
jgi:Fur family ferric uptake transcriptional regulator